MAIYKHHGWLCFLTTTDPFHHHNVTQLSSRILQQEQPESLNFHRKRPKTRPNDATKKEAEAAWVFENWLRRLPSSWVKDPSFEPLIFRAHAIRPQPSEANTPGS